MFKNQKGSPAVTLLFYLILFMPLLSLTVDLGLTQAIKVKAKHDLNLACRAASNQIDLDALADAENPSVFILVEDAWTAYNMILQANLKLDSSNNPLNGSIASGTVKTLYFKVLNQEDLPFLYSYGDFTEEITRPSVTAIVTFPVKTSPLLKVATGLEFINITVHSTVGPELQSQI